MRIERGRVAYEEGTNVTNSKTKVMGKRQCGVVGWLKRGREGGLGKGEKEKSSRRQ